MTKRILTLALLIITLTNINALAQENYSSLIRAKVKHGSLMLGGNMQGNYYLTSSELNSAGQKVNGQRINFNMRGKNGYFIKEDLVVGLDLSILHQSTKITDTSDSPREPRRETFVMAGPFMRYYLLNGIFGELNALVGLHNFNDVNAKYKGFEGGIGVGYAHFINEKFALEPILSLRYFQKEDRHGRTYREMGPMLGFGLQVYLLRTKSHVIKQGL